MPAPFVEDAFGLPLYNFSFFVKNQVFIDMLINIWVFDSIPLANLSDFMLIPSIFHCYSSVIELDIRNGDASRISCIVQDCFAYPGFFFHMKLITVLSRPVKNFIMILMGIVLNL